MGSVFCGKKGQYPRGLRDGLPICLGYVPIAFAFGMQAVRAGLPVWTPVAISMTNLTSAGQFAGLSIILAGGAFLELAVTIFVINIRYMLMSLALSQKLEPSMKTWERCLIAAGNTDEIFAIAVRSDEPLTTRYMLGLITGPYIGWSAGTLLGATATTLLPAIVQNALGITIYAMFLAIFLPPARKSRPILTAVLIAAGVACLFRYTPGLNAVSSGWVVIIATIAAAAFCALRFPVDDEKAETPATEAAT